ncbi:MAG: biosynthetic arginine decarboxylase [Deltaproteobacteria bacterium]|nr:biosynthetic arginine decarboxylase [Deltaproteobacteria bacterium]
MSRSATVSPAVDPLHRWTIKDAVETYDVEHWGRDYFSVNESGNVTVSHERGSIDLKALVDDLTRRGIEPPLLIRFSDLLESRIVLLNEAFHKAIQEYGYRGQYRGVYPIKVNQSRKVVEEIMRFGRRFHYGLEAGSKPELLAVMAMLDDPEALIICNGYKDDAYIETALLTSKLDRTVVIVVEKPSELDTIKRVSDRLGVRPSIGIRMRLSARGSGKWSESGGDHAKFGLTAAQIIDAVKKLEAWDMLDCVRLLHFHAGSQITSIRAIKGVLQETSRMYSELVRLGCRNLDHFDCGGGLAVDYDGSQTNFDSSMNYSVQEYANDVVSAIQEACDEYDLPHPNLVTESGRAVVAHHSVLVVNVIGVSAADALESPPKPEEEEHELLHKLWEVYSTITRKTVRECYHDAIEYKEQALQLFNLGHLSLEARARAENLFWCTCSRIAQVAAALSSIPEDLQPLEKMLSDTYFCNFSMFQSLPDSWAVDQLFPIIPIHRLNEPPTRRGILADITCDSDGSIDKFIDQRDVKTTLELHPLNGEPYYVGIMLTGAYQEILGDMHNLFGNTNMVHVVISGQGYYEVDEVVAGDTVTDVLRYVDYSPEELIRRVRANVETAVRGGKMSLDESRQLMQRYREGLASYTYLE